MELVRFEQYFSQEEPNLKCLKSRLGHFWKWTDFPKCGRTAASVVLRNAALLSICLSNHKRRDYGASEKLILHIFFNCSNLFHTVKLTG